MEHAQPLLSWALVIFGFIISIIIFNTVWGRIRKNINPQDIIDLPENTLKDFKNKEVEIELKNGERVSELKYKKTIYIASDEFAASSLIYFQFINQNKKAELILATEIFKMEVKR
jgi:hypothetical protein